MNIIFYVFLIITCMPYNFTLKYRIKIHSSIINQLWIFMHLKKISKNAQNAHNIKKYIKYPKYCWNFQRIVLGFIQFLYRGLVFLFIFQKKKILIYTKIPNLITNCNIVPNVYYSLYIMNYSPNMFCSLKLSY